MYRQIFRVLALALILASPSLVFGQSSDKDFDEKVVEGIVEVNSLMVEKDRVKALKAIDDVLLLLDTQGDGAYQDTGERLDRVKFFLSKYNWDRARRILKGAMEDIGLEYQPTY